MFAKLSTNASCSSASSHKAFSLAELLVLLAIMGVLASLALSLGGWIVRREKINSVALSMAGYLEEVRSLSLKKVGSIIVGTTDQSTRPCVITFQPPSSAFVPGSVLAAVDSSTVLPSNSSLNCAPLANGSTIKNGELFLPADLNGTVQMVFEQTGLAPGIPAKITFTPRGMWLPAQGASGDLVIKIFLEPSGPMRCLRVSETLAYIDIGSSGSSDITSACNDYTRI